MTDSWPAKQNKQQAEDREISACVSSGKGSSLCAQGNVELSTWDTKAIPAYNSQSHILVMSLFPYLKSRLDKC